MITEVSGNRHDIINGFFKVRSVEGFVFQTGGNLGALHHKLRVVFVEQIFGQFTHCKAHFHLLYFGFDAAQVFFVLLVFLHQRGVQLLKHVHEHFAHMVGVYVRSDGVGLQQVGEMVVQLVASAIAQTPFLAALVVILLLGLHEVAGHGRTATIALHKAAQGQLCNAFGVQPVFHVAFAFEDAVEL